MGRPTGKKGQKNITQKLLPADEKWELSDEDPLPLLEAGREEPQASKRKHENSVTKKKCKKIIELKQKKLRRNQVLSPQRQQN